LRTPLTKTQFRQKVSSPRRVSFLVISVILGTILLLAGCAKYNTYYNAKKHFDDAEHIRDEAIKKTGEAPKVSGSQRTNYDDAIRKSQKVLDEYPGHSLTDDVLFLQGKAYHRMESYRMSIRKLDLLFLNYPATEYLEEALYIQALNYLLLGSLANSQEFLDKLAKSYPESEFQAETRRVSGENAFIMKQYGEAAEEFKSYLNDYPKADERDLIGLKLARCYWEMHDYQPAIEVLQEVSNSSVSADVSFRARLLRSRVHVKMNDFEIVKSLLVELQEEAEIYSSQGQVRLVEVESLTAQDKTDEATSLLESMPEEWQNPEVKARSADILGYALMQRGDWEEAKKEFQLAVRGNDVLDDVDRTRSLLSTLGDFLGAENGLVDASGPKVGRLKLLQANAMIFGFDNPSEAARLYRTAAADTSADSTVVVRALYGAHLAYDEYLDMPDSAAYFANELSENFPNSPQAIFLASDGSADILGHLLAEKKEIQEVALANLSDEERAALVAVLDEEALENASRPVASSKIRRRMVYLKVRENIIFDPSQEMVNQKIAEQEEAYQEAVIAAELTEDLLGVTGGDSMMVAIPDSLGMLKGSTLPVPLDPNAAVPAGEEKDPKKEKEKEEEEEDDGGFDLR